MCKGMLSGDVESSAALVKPRLGMSEGNAKIVDIVDVLNVS